MSLLKTGALVLSPRSVVSPAGRAFFGQAALDAPQSDLSQNRVNKNLDSGVVLQTGSCEHMLSSNCRGGTPMALVDDSARCAFRQHRHGEECFIVEGTMAFGAESFSAGDYVAYAAGIQHTEVHSPTGGTILIRGGYA